MDTATKASLVGSGIALAGLVIAKESKVSDFRQAWIDALRADIALFLSSALQVQAGDHNASSELNVTAARIRLRFKYKDEQSRLLLDRLSLVTTAIHDGMPFPLIHELSNQVLIEAQKVLKKEWTRVKWGEWPYRVLLTLTISLLTYLLWRLHSHP